MKQTLKAKCYLCLGWLSVALGIIGIPTPLLPTTPFLLLAAYCFARGSQRWHDWLLSHRILGPYILAFRDQKGLTVRQKWRIAASILLTLAVTFWMAPRIEGRIGVLLIGAGWLTWLYRYRVAPEAAPQFVPAAAPPIITKLPLAGSLSSVTPLAAATTAAVVAVPTRAAIAPFADAPAHPTHEAHVATDSQS